MIVDILAIAFVTAFTSIVVLGHVLLFRAIWSGRGSDPPIDTTITRLARRGSTPAVAHRPLVLSDSH